MYLGASLNETQTSRNAGTAIEAFLMQCYLRREMGYILEVKRYIYLRTIAKHKVYAEFDFPALPPN